MVCMAVKLELETGKLKALICNEESMNNLWTIEEKGL